MSIEMKTLTIGSTTYEVVDENARTSVAQAVKTINGVAPDENGNVVVGSSSVTIDTTLTVEGQAADAKVVGDAISSLSEEIANLDTSGGTSGGISATARNLLIRILKSGQYAEDQADNILALEAALAATESSGSGTVEQPDDGVAQIGNILSIVSGVAVSQSDTTLLIA